VGAARPPGGGVLTVTRASGADQARIHDLVQIVVDETYGGLWAPPPITIDAEDWSLGWIAVLGDELAGIALTGGEWLDDLWVLKPFRGCGVGSRLLAAAEDEIAGRGHASARLRVVRDNASARAFYERRGWRAVRVFPHERLPVTMVELAKALA
jgi:GNAT superfamily N-acetyltransferase